MVKKSRATQEERPEEHEVPLPGQPDKPKGTTGHPNPEVDFKAILSKYVDEDTAGIITEHIAAAGSNEVFLKPEELLQMLAKFPRQIGASTRKQFLDHWIALNKIVVPEDYDRMADKPAEAVRAMKTGQNQEKFSVDKETGIITVATRDEPNALTYDQAKKLSEETKKSLENREKKEQSDDEPGLIATEGGGYQLNPKAKHLTPAEALAWNAIQQASRQGETRTPEEILKQKVDEFKLLGELTGAGGSKGGMTELVTVLTQAKALFGVDPELKAAVQALTQGGKQSENEKALAARVESLEKELRDERQQKLLDTIEQLRTESRAALETARKEFAKAIEDSRNQKVQMDEMGLMGKVVDKIDSGLNSLTTLVRARIGQAPSEMNAKERKELVNGISKHLEKESEVDALAKAAGITK